MAHDGTPEITFSKVTGWREICRRIFKGLMIALLSRALFGAWLMVLHGVAFIAIAGGSLFGILLAIGLMRMFGTPITACVSLPWSAAIAGRVETLLYNMGYRLASQFATSMTLKPSVNASMASGRITVSGDRDHIQMTGAPRFILPVIADIAAAGR